MRIGIDARLWNESGVGRYVRNLVEQLIVLDKTNEYVLFVLSKDTETIKSKVKNSKFQIREANIRWHSFDEQLTFPGILARENLDLVHFPYFSVPIFYTGKFVVTIHDLILHHFPTGQASTLPIFLYKLKLLGYRFTIREAARKAEAIIAVSESTKKEIIDHLDITAQKISVIYEGVDQQIANSTMPIGKNHKSSAINNKPYFLYVGNVYPHKNVERLLGAFKLFLEQHDGTLVMVGKDDYFYKRLKKLVLQLKLQNKVRFTGYICDEDLGDLYRHAIATVVPSQMEGFSLPVLEAMINSCPVIASDIPVHHEIAKNTVIYCNPNDELDIAQKMLQLLELPPAKRNEYISHGKAKAESFLWEKTAKETVKLYESSASIRSS